ncbi:MAG: ABC transporter substrate-binding protein [Verrucomicrobia bacterium]|nr:ABC transporter substrate-binding protein [Verrucomicrobiota bacterium]MBV8378290.1 ABC transporter substrate-binding protein [Verrucomicrobiota bacterium]
MAKPIWMRVCLGVLILLSLAPHDAHAEIKIGAVTCLTGALSTFGVSSIEGAKMAVEEINAGGATLGQSIQLIVEDNGSKAGETATIVRKFISQDKVAAILGDLTSSATMEGAPLAQAAKIPLLTPSATNVAITRIGDYIFRSCFVDPFTGKIMAKFALDHLKAHQAIVMTDVKQDYSVGLTEAIVHYFDQNGARVSNTFSYSSGDTDFRTQLTGVRTAHPDIVFLPGYYTEAALILLQARQLGIKCPFVGGEGWDSPTLVQVAGKAADGNYYTDHFSATDPDPRVQKFVQIYRAKYSTIPDALAALWYDGARLLALAVQRAGSTDGSKIRDALAATRDFDGVTGRISIDENRNAAKPGVILKIENGQPEMVQRVIP